MMGERVGEGDFLSSRQLPAVSLRRYRSWSKAGAEQGKGGPSHAGCLQIPETFVTFQHALQTPIEGPAAAGRC